MASHVPQNDRDIYSDSGRKAGKKKVWIIAIAAVVIVAVLIAAFFVIRSINQQKAAEAHEAEVAALLDTDTFYDGIVVQGVDLGGMTMEEAEEKLKSMEDSLRDVYSISLKYGDKEWKITEDDLTFTFNTEDVLKEAMAYGREGDREERFKKVSALKETPVTFEITNTMSHEGVKTIVKEIAGEIDKDMENASVKGFDSSSKKFSFKEGTPGVKVDQNRLNTLVDQAIEEGNKTATIEIPVEEIPVEITVDQLSSRMKQLSYYETIATAAYASRFNMGRALESFSGVVLQPGETCSFFGRVGPCGKADGYIPANAILNGRFVPSYGGGICQASTTIYGAVLRAGVEIVERSNHSIPSTYCPIGQDSTVSYPSTDLKFKNNTEYPMYIYSGMDGNVCWTAVYGYQDPSYDKIEVYSKLTETIPARTTKSYQLDNSLQKGQIRLDSNGRTGYRAIAWRVYLKDGKEVKREDLSSSYYPPSGIYYSYGPGTDISDEPGPSSGESSSSTGSQSSKPNSSSSSSSKPSSSSSSSKPSSSSSSSKPSSSSSEAPSSSESTPEQSSSAETEHEAA